MQNKTWLGERCCIQTICSYGNTQQGWVIVGPFYNTHSLKWEATDGRLSYGDLPIISYNKVQRKRLVMANLFITVFQIDLRKVEV